ncbi:MAG TPA: hypothetical protein VND65_16470 [Candidatus Binatia bacterium]|nr:hypothetical protein [Candidatus Binatia bacterium]
MKLIAFLLLLAEAAFAQTAPPVTGIQATQQNGQTFITWNDAATGSLGSNYRYNLYRSTSCPITSTATAILVQQALYNNSAQLTGVKPFEQWTRQNTYNPMVTLSASGAALPVWSGLAAYTNLAKATACYAVITHDITGATADSAITLGGNSMTGTVAESLGTVTPILQIPGTSSSRMNGCSNCYVTSASIGQPMFLELHASGGSAPAWGDEWAYWGNANMGYQDGTQSMFVVYQDVTGTKFNSGFKNQLILGPSDLMWSKGAGGNSLFSDASTQTYWYGVMDSINFPTAYSPPADTGVYVFPYTQAKLALILPFAMAYYQPDPNRIFGHGVSMGGFGSLHWSFQQPNLFAGIFVGDPIINSWGKIPQIDYGAAGGSASVANGSTAVGQVSGPMFGKYLAGNGAGAGALNLTITTETKTVSTVATASKLTLKNNYEGNSGTQTYITGSGKTCSGIPAGQPCGAGLVTDATTTDTLPDGVTQYNTVTNTSAWVAENCARVIPYVAWSAGRLDTTAAGMWAMSPALAGALATCHYGFSFGWANDIHGTVTEGIVTPLEGFYLPLLHKNISYPAFTNFSQDNNYGNGNTNNGDCITGNATVGPFCFVNYGWDWSPPVDTPTTWSTSFSNALITSGTCPNYSGYTLKCATTGTVSVTPRNTQSFNVPPGASVQWSTNNGQSGTAIADSYGLVTVTVTFGVEPVILTLQF